MKFLYGFLVIGLGVLLVLKTEWLVNNFGRIEWAEEHLGTEGGTRVLWKIIGVILIFGSFLAMTGVFNRGLTGAFGGFFKNEGPYKVPE